jgi:hypothetical protein
VIGAYKGSNIQITCAALISLYTLELVAFLLGIQEFTVSHSDTETGYLSGFSKYSAVLQIRPVPRPFLFVFTVYPIIWQHIKPTECVVSSAVTRKSLNVPPSVE